MTPAVVKPVAAGGSGPVNVAAYWASKQAPVEAPVVTPAPAAPVVVQAEGRQGVDVPPQVVDMVIDFEESGVCKCKPYLDPVGVPTIGFGSIWDWRDSPCTRVTMETPEVDEHTARCWVGLELSEAAMTISRDVKVPLTENQVAALEDFVFNLGSGSLEASALLRKLNAKDYAGAAAEFDKWDHAGGKEMAGLLRRRQAETKLFQS